MKSHLKISAELMADMIKRRDDMRLILGDNYEAHAREARSVLRGLSSDADISLVNVALKVSKAMLDNGHDPSIVIAALVDELEGQ